MFYLLEETRYMDGVITEKMIKTVGFRNIIVHEYGKIGLAQVLEVAQKDIHDLTEFIKTEFIKSTFQKLELS